MSTEFDNILLNTVLHDAVAQNINRMTQLDIPEPLIHIVQEYHSHCEQAAEDSDDFLRAISSIEQETQIIIGTSRRWLLGNTLVALSEPEKSITDQTRLGHTLIILLALEHGAQPQDLLQEMSQPSDTTLLTAPLEQQPRLLDESIRDYQFTADIMAELAWHHELSEQTQDRLEHCQIHLRALRRAADVSEALGLLLNNDEVLGKNRVAVLAADILLDLHDRTIDLDEAMDRIEELLATAVS